MRETVLVTGSSGRFGVPLVEALQQQYRIVRMDPRPPENYEIPSDQRVITASVTDPQKVAEAMEDVDIVIHSGAIPFDQPPFEDVVLNNVAGTFNVLEAAGRSTQVRHVLFLSSLCWHGIGLGDPAITQPQYLPIDEEQPSVAISAYGMSKVQGELWCRAYVKRFKKPAMALRPGWIVPPHIMPTLTVRPPRKTPWLMDYVGTTDLIDAVFRLLRYDPPEGFDAFLFSASDHMCTMQSLDLAAQYFPGVPVDREALERHGGYGSFISTAKAADRLGWTANYRCNRSGDPV